MKKKTIISIIINIIILILESFVIIRTIINKQSIGIEYYTTLSNIIALITSLLYVIFAIMYVKNETEYIPKKIKILRYIATTSLTLTFLVVITILKPTTNLSYKILLFSGNMLYQHTICPILSIISFIFFERIDIKGFKEITKAVYFTYLYAIIAIILNITKTLDGPYPFLRVYNQSIYVSIIWLIAIMSLVNLLAYILIILNRKFNKN